MAIRADAVRVAAARLLEPLGADDQIVVAPFTKTIGSVTGPTTDRATVLDAISAIRHTGGTAILDALSEAAEHADLVHATESGRVDHGWLRRKQ